MGPVLNKVIRPDRLANVIGEVSKNWGTRTISFPPRPPLAMEPIAAHMFILYWGMRSDLNSARWHARPVWLFLTLQLGLYFPHYILCRMAGRAA